MQWADGRDIDVRVRVVVFLALQPKEDPSTQRVTGATAVGPSELASSSRPRQEESKYWQYVMVFSAKSGLEQ